MSAGKEGGQEMGVIVIVEHTAVFATREYFISETFRDTESFGALRWIAVYEGTHGGVGDSPDRFLRIGH